MKPRTVSKLLTSTFFSLLLVSSLKYIPICIYICWKVSGRFCWGAKNGGGGWAFPLDPFFTLGLLITGIISDHERTSTRAVSEDGPQACRRGSRAPAPRSPGVRRRKEVRACRQPSPARGWVGSAADGAGGAGEQEQMDGAPDGSGSPGPVQVARANSGPAAGAGEGRATGMGRGPPFSMTMPRRRVQRRRNQRFIGSS